jgi:murein DD-endopeptidase MepM/ murein hydrolase activator NlpD
MFKACFLTTVLLVITSISLIAQDRYPKDYFRSPVDFPISLSGTFAELRNNHFHSGIDIRTQGVEGKNVYACADGYVSRIKISPFGFGKALYISHPNGFTTVYAHLQKLNPVIEAWVKSEQYRLEKFDVDLFPPKELLKVKKGEIICYSGNSGSSEGPHLHFEIRDTKTEMIIDPQLFGLPIKDLIRPVISSVKIVPEGSGAKINGKYSPLTPELAGWGPVYKLKDPVTIKVAGSFSLGIQVHDLLDGSSNKNGICRYSVYIDSMLMFDWQAARFSFSETRYINSFIDYAQYIKYGQRYIMTRIAPNNKLSMYKNSINRGVFATIPDSVQKVKVVVSDAAGNESILQFKVKGEKADIPKTNEINKSPVFTYAKTNTFSEKGFELVVPGKSLYEDMAFTYAVSKATLTTCSRVYQIHNPETPLHDYIELTIAVDSVYQKLGRKLVIARLKPGKAPSSIGGKYENSNLKASIREFGQYAVMADSTAPVIKPVNISEGKSVADQQSFRITITDNFSGIMSYNAYLNGKWILMDYDAKNRMLEYKRDDRLIKGKNEFLLKVEDYCGNSTTYKAALIN